MLTYLTKIFPFWTPLRCHTHSMLIAPGKSDSGFWLGVNDLVIRLLQLSYNVRLCIAITERMTYPAPLCLNTSLGLGSTFDKWFVELRRCLVEDCTLEHLIVGHWGPMLHEEGPNLTSSSRDQDAFSFSLLAEPVITRSSCSELEGLSDERVCICGWKTWRARVEVSSTHNPNIALM